MSIANAVISIGNGQYPLTQLRGKTIYAAKKLPLYASYKPGAAVRGYVNAGEYIGIIQGFVANGYKGAKGSFFIIGNTTNDPNTRFIPYSQNNFSQSKLTAQGTKTSKDIVKEEQTESEAWYIKVIKQVAPYAIGGVVIYALINKKF